MVADPVGARDGGDPGDGAPGRVTADRAALEGALRRSELISRSLADRLTQRIFVKDLESRYLFANAAYAGDLGVDPESVVGKDDHDFFPPEFADAYRADDREVMESGATKDIEERYTVGGVAKWIHTVKVPFRDERGGIIGVLGSFEDITARKTAEDALREKEYLLSEAQRLGSIGSWFVDAEGRVSGSEEYYRLHGIEPAAYPQDVSSVIGSLVHPEDREAVREWVRKLAEGKEPAEVEYRILRPDGAVRVFQARGSLSGRGGTGPGHMAGTVQDVTQRVARASQLRQSQKMEAVGKLAGGVAHDFNNMLCAILGYGELALGRLREGDPVRDHVVEILKAGRRSAALTGQLLAFSRRQTLQPEWVDLNGLLGDLRRMLERLIGEDIDLRLAADPALGTVMVDRGQMEQVVMNLVVNARDAMPGGGTLTIETANVDLDDRYVKDHADASPGRHVVTMVSDTGCGMDAATMARIFEPFFTTKEQGKGTGLGLPTAYGIVKQSGGHMTAYSEIGHGSVFRVYLPRIDAPAGPREEPGGAAPLAGEGRHVLVVEDEPMVRGLLEGMLGELGFRVTAAASGAEALALVDGGRLEPDLVLTDMIMPGMTGTDLVERLRRVRPGLRAAIMSGYSEGSVSSQGLLGPGTRFLRKPFTSRELAAAVGGALGDG